MNAKKPAQPRKKGTLISDIVWGVGTLLVLLYSLYLTHQTLFVTDDPAIMVFSGLFWIITLILATQAPVKE